MSALPLNGKKTALLLLDLQVGIVQRFPSDTRDSIINSTTSAINTARKHDVQVAYIRVALSEADFEAIPDTGPANFTSMKSNPETSAMMHPDSPATQIDPKLAPVAGDLVYRKIRYGAFMNGPSKGLLDDFAAKGIVNVVIGGVATSGAVLSVVRQLSDLDFRLVVLEDCCADFDVELHNVLCEKVISKQAEVIKSTELEGLLK